MGNETNQPLFTPAYGIHDLVKEDHQVFVEKVYTLHSPQEKETLERLLRSLKEIQSPTLLQFLNVFECKNSNDLVVQFEHLPLTL